jgi:hypothetical protein
MPGRWQLPHRPEAINDRGFQPVAINMTNPLKKLKRDLPSPRRRGRSVPMRQPAKLALCQAMREHGLNKVTLAQNLGKKDGVVRRMLDLDPPDEYWQLENALWLLGKQVASEVREAPERLRASTATDPCLCRPQSHADLPKVARGQSVRLRRVRPSISPSSLSGMHPELLTGAGSSGYACVRRRRPLHRGAASPGRLLG